MLPGGLRAGSRPRHSLRRQFTSSRYAAVGNSFWAKLLFDWWTMILPVWPIASDWLRYFEIVERSAVLQ